MKLLAGQEMATHLYYVLFLKAWNSCSIHVLVARDMNCYCTSSWVDFGSTVTDQQKCCSMLQLSGAAYCNWPAVERQT